jgi:hypothetical protein
MLCPDAPSSSFIGDRHITPLPKALNATRGALDTPAGLLRPRLDNREEGICTILFREEHYGKMDSGL